MVCVLTTLGIIVEEEEDAVTIHGVGDHGISNAYAASAVGTQNLAPFSIDSLGDHRIAMATVVAAFALRRAVIIKNCANVATSFPGFTDLAAQLGLTIRIA